MTEHARRRKKPKPRGGRAEPAPARAAGLGDRPFDNIARRDVIELGERLVVAGKPVLANRVQALISSIYSLRDRRGPGGGKPGLSAAQARRRDAQDARAVR